MRKFCLFTALALAVAAVSVEKSQAQHCSFGNCGVQAAFVPSFGFAQPAFVGVNRSVFVGSPGFAFGVNRGIVGGVNRGFAFANVGNTVVVNNQRGLFGFNRSQQVIISGGAGAVVVNNQRGFRFR